MNKKSKEDKYRINCGNKGCLNCYECYKKAFPSQPNSEEKCECFERENLGEKVWIVNGCPIHDEVSPKPEELQKGVKEFNEKFGHNLNDTSNEWEPIAYGKNISEVRQILAQYLPEWKNKMLCDLAELVSQSEQRVRKEMVEQIIKGCPIIQDIHAFGDSLYIKIPANYDKKQFRILPDNIINLISK